ncbi:hypothetical protein CYMTET_32266 [Cymbomonas tetramitiformis]|uniref:Uncharacterized protein n=1 Tax=Cymbomonas tetramitiformis TaxID=36881 RepID=A0AAE0FFD2_9CHLO|nr:hypothetical protein CYMTET_32266 [Cymbomonas tetramitiformis]
MASSNMRLSAVSERSEVDEVPEEEDLARSRQSVEVRLSRGQVWFGSPSKEVPEDLEVLCESPSANRRSLRGSVGASHQSFGVAESIEEMAPEGSPQKREDRGEDANAPEEEKHLYGRSNLINMYTTAVSKPTCKVNQTGNQASKVPLHTAGYPKPPQVGRPATPSRASIPIGDFSAVDLEAPQAEAGTSMAKESCDPQAVTEVASELRNNSKASGSGTTWVLPEAKLDGDDGIPEEDLPPEENATADMCPSQGAPPPEKSSGSTRSAKEKLPQFHAIDNSPASAARDKGSQDLSSAALLLPENTQRSECYEAPHHAGGNTAGRSSPGGTARDCSTEREAPAEAGSRTLQAREKFLDQPDEDLDLFMDDDIFAVLKENPLPLPSERRAAGERRVASAGPSRTAPSASQPKAGHGARARPSSGAVAGTAAATSGGTASRNPYKTPQPVGRQSRQQRPYETSKESSRQPPANGKPPARKAWQDAGSKWESEATAAASTKRTSQRARSEAEERPRNPSASRQGEVGSAVKSSSGSRHRGEHEAGTSARSSSVGRQQGGVEAGRGPRKRPEADRGANTVSDARAGRASHVDAAALLAQTHSDSSICPPLRKDLESCSGDDASFDSNLPLSILRRLERMDHEALVTLADRLIQDICKSSSVMKDPVHHHVPTALASCVNSGVAGKSTGIVGMYHTAEQRQALASNNLEVGRSASIKTGCSVADDEAASRHASGSKALEGFPSLSLVGIGDENHALPTVKEGHQSVVTLEQPSALALLEQDYDGK